MGEISVKSGYLRGEFIQRLIVFYYRNQEKYIDTHDITGYLRTYSNISGAFSSIIGNYSDDRIYLICV